MMGSEEPQRRLTWAVVAGTSALILTVVLLQSLSQLQVVAQPILEDLQPEQSPYQRCLKARMDLGETEEQAKESCKHLLGGE